MLLVIPYWVDYCAPALVYGCALLRGGAPERITGVAFGLTWLTGLAIHDRLGQMPAFETTKDVLRMAVIVWLAVRFDRWWLIVGGATALLCVATDVAGVLTSIRSWAFGTALWIWTWIFLVALSAGVWIGPRRRRSEAVAPKSNTPPAPRAGPA